MPNDKITYLTDKSVPKFPPRERDSHKGDYGRVLLIGGSFGMSGAIAMAGHAAILTGSGLVRLAVPERSLPMAAGFAAEPMTVALPENRSGKISLDAFTKLMSLMDDADVVAIGPGLGRSAGLDALVMRLHREASQPMLIDADGLNALASHGFDRLAGSFAETAARGAWRILTPHPGEFARLCEGTRFLCRDGKIPRDTPGRIAAARDFISSLKTRSVRETDRGAAQNSANSADGKSAGGVVLVLKGSETVVSDGEQTFVNTSGNPGMATAGSGDVLSGMIASLVGQRFSTLDAARLGVYLHGRSGDLALVESRIPPESVTASTLLDHIGPAIRELNPGEIRS